MCGMVPFGEDCEDPYEIYDLISNNDISFPNYFLTKENKEAKKIIIQILSKTPEARLGGSYDTLKAHPWFDIMDWDKLYHNKVEVPYFPESNFMMPENEIKEVLKKNISISVEISKLNKQFKKTKNKNPS